MESIDHDHGRLRLMRLGLSALAAALCLAATGAAQTGARAPRARIQLSTGVARVGEEVGLTLLVEDAQRARIVGVPEVDGLRLDEPQGPSRTQNVMSFNGAIRRQTELRWRVDILCEREGEFEIPPFEVDVAGTVLRTQSEVLKVVRDMTGEDLGFFRIRASSAKVVEGQPFTLELLFGWEERLNVNYANLSLPWWNNLSGTLELEREADPGARESVGVNDRYKVPVQRVQDPSLPGKRVYRISRSYLAARSGVLDFPTSFLEFGYRRGGGFFSQARVDNYFVRAAPLDLEVVPLPRENQPPEYTGAVGSLSAKASADTRSLLAGDSVKLTVDWTGTGNMEFFGAPDLALDEAFRDFRFYGSTEEKGFDRRRVVYDLAPNDERVTEIPPVSLWVFDPERMEYVEVRTDPIPIRVRPLENAVTLAQPEGERYERDIHDIHVAAPGAASADPASGRADRVLAGVGLGLVPAWLLLRTLVRRRRGDPAAPRERRRRRARRSLRRALEREPSPKEALDAFAAFLAARSGEPDQAWMGRDLDAYARAHVPEPERPAWSRAAALVGELERAAYADGPQVERGAILEAADRLTRAGL